MSGFYLYFFTHSCHPHCGALLCSSYFYLLTLLRMESRDRCCRVGLPLLVFLALSLYLFTGLLSGLPRLHNLHPLDALFSFLLVRASLNLALHDVSCPSPVLLVLPFLFAGLDCVYRPLTVCFHLSASG